MPKGIGVKTTIGATVPGGTSIVYRTGDWREFRPTLISRIAPCREACPAGVNIQDFLWESRYEQFEQAWRILTEENPFPSICGRVCGHPCEGACNRKDFDAPLSIHAVERFIGDYGLERGLAARIPVPDLKKKIAVVGSGPAGLSCAYHLRRLGYRVTVFERTSRCGGMLRWGIPEYRLPQVILDNEIEKLQKMDIQIEMESSVPEDFLREGLREYAAIFLALGSQKDLNMGIPGEQLPGVFHGLEFLRRIKEGKTFTVGRQVAIAGGGNTALDVARTAIRLGSIPVLLYRRSREEMPALPEEVEEALKEGVRIEFLVSPISIHGMERKRLRIECLRNRLGEPGVDGRKSPVPIAGSNFSIEVDAVLSAFGETVASEDFLQPLARNEARISVNDWQATSMPGVFAGGDAALSEKTVAHAIGAGKKAALSIDAYIQRRSFDRLQPLLLGTSKSPSMAYRLCSPPEGHRIDQVVRFDDLNLYGSEHLPREQMPQRPAEQGRTRSFDEVNLGFDQEMVLREARRCFRCGSCSFCENCYVFCPDGAVIRKMKERIIDINYDFCKGCGICANECSSHFIDIVPEGK